MSSRERGRASNMPAWSIISSQPVASPRCGCRRGCTAAARADGARVRLRRHPREVEPVIAVRAHDHRVAVVDLGEELARPRPELPEPRAERRLHEVAHREKIVVAQERHVLRHRAGNRAACSSALATGLLRRQVGLRCSSGRGRCGPGRAPARRARAVRARCRVRVHVPQVPVVVLDAYSRRPVLRGSCPRFHDATRRWRASPPRREL